MMPTLYVMAGMSFAGKTTLARAIHEATGLPLIVPDAVAAERGWRLDELGSGALSPAQWHEMMDVAVSRTASLLLSGRSVLFDTTASSPDSREGFRRLAAENRAAVCFVAVMTPRDEARRRWERNNVTRERFTVTWEHFQACADAWRPPTADEGGPVGQRVLYFSGEEVPPWIERHFGEERAAPHPA